ncbi:hypothetical protein MLD38_037029 [Melastoma candidum]|uniref:Uncharacterized protein n=1 Tax=Melastoma candidum TaxID=119954 RepID=A0ACB9LLK3_9MYRT|nr:hypothetical protein MLD38_037029 [Melastoma candidum]
MRPAIAELSHTSNCCTKAILLEENLSGAVPHVCEYAVPVLQSVLVKKRSEARSYMEQTGRREAHLQRRL